MYLECCFSFFFTFSVVCDTHFLNFNQQPHHYHQLHHRPHRQRMGKAWVVAATQQADEQDESSSTFTYEICNYLNVFTFPNLLCNLHHHSEFVRKFTTYKLQRRNTFTQSYISGWMKMRTKMRLKNVCVCVYLHLSICFSSFLFPFGICEA